MKESRILKFYQLFAKSVQLEVPTCDVLEGEDLKRSKTKARNIWSTNLPVDSHKTHLQRRRIMLYRLVLGLVLGAISVHGWIVPSLSSRTTTRLQLTETSNNVVLRPSDDPEAFDSFRVGSARVHRYSRDGDDSEAEYVMWYHGRPENFDSNKELPPLTTGRIGRATSRNGLAWKKSIVGSESEDAPDVTLGLNKESWWGFDTAHIGLGQVLLPMSTPAVMTEGGVYLMYYMGGNWEETPIASYLEGEPQTEESIKGMQMKIGVALSQDGISWGRVEGDDPSGACMVPYDSSDPNMQAIANLRDDKIAEELYVGWPDVVVHNVADEQMTEEGKKEAGFYMYYSTMRKSDKQKCIALAASPDGFRWLKRGVCLEPDATGPDAGGCARSTVIQKAEFNEESNSWESLDGWTMYYEGVAKEDGKHRIMMAESENGRTWEKRGVVLDVGASEDVWDCMGVGSPHIIRYVFDERR